jgi:hypothetical protein
MEGWRVPGFRLSALVLAGALVFPLPGWCWGAAPGAPTEASTVDAETEQEDMDRSECTIALIPLRTEAEPGTGLPRDSAIMADGCSGETLILKYGDLPESKAGAPGRGYYWAIIPRPRVGEP